MIGVDRKRSGIGTLSEKTVHAILKNYYEPDEEKQEIPIENSVADIFSDGGIMELHCISHSKGKVDYLDRRGKRGIKPEKKISCKRKCLSGIYRAL